MTFITINLLTFFITLPSLDAIDNDLHISKNCKDFLEYKNFANT